MRVRVTLSQCCTCRRQTSVTAGTIFQDTRKPLVLWFRAMWYVTSQKNGASALGVQRVLGLGSYEYPPVCSARGQVSLWLLAVALTEYATAIQEGHGIREVTSAAPIGTAAPHSQKVDLASTRQWGQRHIATGPTYR